MTFMQLFLQMLPLIVFIIVDAIFNNLRVSIISAIMFAAGQLAFYYVKSGRFDWFVLLDVGLIVGLGAVSVALKNDIFFKVKPAIIEVAAMVFFIALILSPDKFLFNYFGRMMPKGVVLNPAAIGAMKVMLVWMCGYMLVHIGAVLYTAFYSSRTVWAFVSGPGFYLLFIPIMVWIIIKAVRKRRKGKAHYARSGLPVLPQSRSKSKAKR
jgi:intracellular septation protein A